MGIYTHDYVFLDRGFKYLWQNCTKFVEKKRTTPALE